MIRTLVSGSEDLRAIRYIPPSIVQTLPCVFPDMKQGLIESQTHKTVFFVGDTTDEYARAFFQSKPYNPGAL
jgi:hypothetical protein